MRERGICGDLLCFVFLFAVLFGVIYLLNWNSDFFAF